MPALRLGVKFLPSMAVRTVGARSGCLSAADRRLLGLLAAHRTGTLAFAGCAEVRSSFALLLSGHAFGFLSRGPAQVPQIPPIGFIFRGACLLHRDRDCLPATLDWSAFPTGPALQFAMLELMHHTAGDALLPG